MTRIHQYEEKTLRQIAKEVLIKDISTEKIQKIISDMAQIMASQDDDTATGIAIAAPQIGVSLRIFIVSDDVMKKVDEKYKSLGRNLVFINPEILKLSKKTHEIEEGCLSVRGKYGKVKRSVKATIKGYNELGEMVERGASGLLAQIFQHEIDHLNGKLFIDKARDVQYIPPQTKTND